MHQPDFSEMCRRQHDGIDKKLTSIESTLLGNGKEGLVTRMSKVEEFVSGAKDDIRDLLRFQWKLAGGAVVVNILCSVVVAIIVKKII